MAEIFDYSFTVWPDETWKFHPAIIMLYEVMGTRLQLDHSTEAEFAEFRDGLGRHGLTLREIERVPHHVPETIL